MPLPPLPAGEPALYWPLWCDVGHAPSPLPWEAAKGAKLLYSGRWPEVKTHLAGEGRGEWEAEKGGMKPSILEGAHSQELTSSPELHSEKPHLFFP